jgi:hypothetical protein
MKLRLHSSLWLVSSASRGRTIPVVAAAMVLVLGAAPGVRAELSIPYASVGTYNSDVYTFTATATGDVVAYFAGSGAAYDNQLGLLVNGVQQGGFGLDDHSSPVGQAYDFGSVTAGSTLVFILENLSLGKNAYSDPSLNVSYDSGPASGTTNGHNHVYSTFYDGLNPGSGTAALNTAGVPHGTFVAFEDLQFPGADYNYNDETFVFTNVSTAIGVPEPSSALIVALTVGLAGFGVALNRRFAKAA